MFAQCPLTALSVSLRVLHQVMQVGVPLHLSPVCRGRRALVTRAAVASFIWANEGGALPGERAD
jgi:hypothetical protein